jgi:hypothetical protein
MLCPAFSGESSPIKLDALIAGRLSLRNKKKKGSQRNEKV